MKRIPKGVSYYCVALFEYRTSAGVYTGAYPTTPTATLSRNGDDTPVDISSDMVPLATVGEYGVTITTTSRPADIYKLTVTGVGTGPYAEEPPATISFEVYEV